MSEFLTLAEAAALLRCSTKTLRRRIHAGVIRCFWNGPRILFRRADLVSWLSGESHGPTA